ncbi:MAG: hypothetical protein LBJ18_04460 [Rickettsiales bacterium]|jgi:hypothetical protein|nr:hypothetical protein [Rickettsiales bacterium]
MRKAVKNCRIKIYEKLFRALGLVCLFFGIAKTSDSFAYIFASCNKTNSAATINNECNANSATDSNCESWDCVALSTSNDGPNLECSTTQYGNSAAPSMVTGWCKCKSTGCKSGYTSYGGMYENSCVSPQVACYKSGTSTGSGSVACSGLTCCGSNTYGDYSVNPRACVSCPNGGYSFPEEASGGQPITKCWTACSNPNFPCSETVGQYNYSPTCYYTY